MKELGLEIKNIDMEKTLSYSNENPKSLCINSINGKVKIRMKKGIWAKKCKICKKNLAVNNRSGYCRVCYRGIWKELNYNGKKRKEFKDYKKVC